MNYIFNIIALLGGLALFLFGMDVMGKGLERSAGGKLQTILAKMSSTVFKGFLLGTAVTLVIQSSSATTVMVVGFVNSGIMTLQQSVGVIFGANLGTCITAWILSMNGLEASTGFIMQIFKPSTLAPLLGTIGIVIFMFSKKQKTKDLSSILLGFMALMTGMEVMSDAMAFLEEEAWFANMMISFNNPVLGILVGMVLTAIIQSSSASMGILISLCSTGAVTYANAIPIILGFSIGTCITAMIGALGANRNARRAAAVHLIFNVVSVVLFAIVFYVINIFYRWPFLDTLCSGWHLALFQTVFKLLAIFVALPLNKALVKLAYVFIPKQTDPQKIELLDERLLATPAVAIQQAQEIAGKMALVAQSAMEKAMGLMQTFSEEGLKEVTEMEDETDRYEDALGSYLVKLTGKRLSVDDNRALNTLLYTIGDVERIADHALGVAHAAKEMADKNVTFSAQAQQELAMLGKAVMAVISCTVEAYHSNNLELAMKVEPQEQVVDSLVREIKSRHIRRLRDGLCTVEYGFILDDILTAYSRSADHCSNVAVEMLQVAEGKLEAHEYLNALKAGELQESAKFSQRFAQYKALYQFPDEQ